MSLLNVFKQIRYDEASYSLGEFTIGFELEAWTDEESEFYDFLEMSNKFFKEGKTIQRSKKSEWSVDPTVNPGGEDSTCHSCGGSGDVVSLCGTCDGAGILQEDCDECNGTGTIAKENGDPEKCVYCNGTGRRNNTCYHCHGRGQTYEMCDECGGDGFIAPSKEGKFIFEWKSPIFNFTPKNIQLIIQFLSKAVREKSVSTNETCGFHIHIGFPDKTRNDIDMFWVICQLASENKLEMFYKILDFENIKLYHGEYASPSKLKRLIDIFMHIGREELTTEESMEYLRSFYSGYKYTILRQHPQGTLEWRGPRGFLDVKQYDIIKSFILTKLYPFIKWISNSLDKKELKSKSFSISKADFINIVSKWPSTITIKKRKYGGKFINTTPENVKLIFNKYPWLTQCKFKSVHVIKIEVGEFVLDEGTFLDGKYLDGYFRNSSFSGGQIINGKLFNCYIKKNTIIINGNFSNCHIDYDNNNKIIHNGIFLSGTINYAIISNGKFKNVNFNKCVIEGGMFDNCLFNDVSIRNGKFLKNNITKSSVYGGMFSNNSIEKSVWYGGVWINGDFDKTNLWLDKKNKQA